jgi:hypothetical protein
VDSRTSRDLYVLFVLIAMTLAAVTGVWVANQQLP